MNEDEFYKEKIYIAKRDNVSVLSIRIDEEHATGELCIFSNGKWLGYIDNEFYEEMYGF